MNTKPSSTKATPLAREVAARLERQVAETDTPTLPSMSVLGARYGVSRPTLIAAVRLLAAQGLVRVYRGSRIRIVGREQPLPAARDDGCGRLLRFIREQILDSTYTAGSPLPKQSSFAHTHKVSMRTVRKVYALLFSEGIISRSGRAWVAGRRDSIRSTSRRVRPLLLIVARKPVSWTWYFQSERTHSFASTFTAEIERKSVRPVVAGYDTVADELVVSQAGIAPRRISDVIPEFGSEYAGSLVVGSSNELDLTVLLPKLLKLGKPVVWLDALDEPGVALPDSQLFACCRFSEKRALETSLRFLAGLGHRKVGFLSPTSAHWTRRRGEELRRIGASMTPLVDVDTWYPDSVYRGGAEGLRAVRKSFSALCRNNASFRAMFVRLREQVGPDAQIPGESLERFLTRYAHGLTNKGSGSSIPPDAHDAARLAFITPLMARAFLDSDRTAILVCNDAHSWRVIQWLDIARIPVPHRLSLISFDNNIVSKPPTMTSVDFGFGYLGYCACHFILKDVPVRRERSGDIVSRPQVVEGWSTGRPCGAVVSPFS